MGRAVTILLIVLALTNIAYGDLLRPCQCDAENGSSCGFCPAERGVKEPSAPPC